MDFRDPDAMSLALSKVLRYGVLASAAITLVGTALLVANNWGAGTGSELQYNAGAVPHTNFDVSLGGLISGLEGLQPFAIIELGALLLIATPVARVMVSIFLFAAEKDRLYVAVTVAVLALLLFSMLVAPLIPAFQA